MGLRAHSRYQGFDHQWDANERQSFTAGVSKTIQEPFGTCFLRKLVLEEGFGAEGIQVVQDFFQDRNTQLLQTYSKNDISSLSSFSSSRVFFFAAEGSARRGSRAVAARRVCASRVCASGVCGVCGVSQVAGRNQKSNRRPSKDLAMVLESKLMSDEFGFSSSS